MVWIRKSIILMHRYLGIVLSLMFLMWFLTGIGMIYSRGMPRLTPDVRLARMPELDLGRVRLSLSEAGEAALLGDVPQRAVLFSVLDRPAYRFTDRGSVTVFADNGELLPEINEDQARIIAGRFMRLPESQMSYAGLLEEADQWTMTLVRQFPLHRILANDPSRTELYVSPGTGEVVQVTTRGSRLLSWVSTIPHFLYFAPLRAKTELWWNLVVGTSALGCVLAFLGIALGIWHSKFKRPFQWSRISSYFPYTGWMRWHYITGLVFGVFTLTWAFSGMLSMEPFEWSQRDGGFESGLHDAFPGGPADRSEFPALVAANWKNVLGERPIKEIEFAEIMNEPHYIVRGAPDQTAEPGWPDGGHQPYYVMRGKDPVRRVIAANRFEIRQEPFSAAAISDRVRKAMPELAITETQLLTEYDYYYYSRDSQSPLPVVRVKLDDPNRTWLYVDPEVGQLAGQVNSGNRVERWLYNGLHSLDFPFWYYRRPVWDIGVILLSLGGAMVSGIGLVLGIRRVRRGVKRAAQTLGAPETVRPDAASGAV